MDVKPRCIRQTASPQPIMSMSKLPPGSPASSSEEECQWDWQCCTPESGTEKFVMALQLLGIDLSKAVPRNIQEEAITSLDKTPTSDLIVGKFARTPTKERLLSLS